MQKNKDEPVIPLPNPIEVEEKDGPVPVHPDLLRGRIGAPDGTPEDVPLEE